MKSKSLLGILLLSLFLMSSIAQPVSAFSHDSFTILPLTNLQDRPQTQTQLHGATGRYVHVSPTATGIRVIVENESGNLADVSIVTGTTTYGIGFVTIAEEDYSATQVLLFSMPLAASALFTQAYFIVYDVTLFTYTLYHLDNVIFNFWGRTGYTMYIRHSKIIQTSAGLWVVGAFGYASSSALNQFVACWIDESTHTVYKMYDYSSWASDNLNLQLSQMIYVGDDNFMVNFNYGATAYKDNHWYMLDLSLGTIIDVCAGVSSDRTTNDKRLFNLYQGKGYEWNSTTIYVYSVYIYPYLSGVNTMYRVVYDKMAFDTSITTAHLLGHNELTSTIAVSYSTSVLTWCVGYVEGSNHDDVYVYYLSSVAGVDILFEACYVLSDFWDYTAPTLTLVSTTEVGSTMIPIDNKEDALSWTPTGNYLARETSAGTTLWIYYDMSPITYDFDYTVSYTPADYPLHTSQSYTFVYTVTESGVGYPYVQVSLYVDNATIPSASKLTNSNGQISQIFVFNTEGTHEIRVVITYEGSTYFDDDYDYLVIAYSIPPSEFPIIALDTYIGLFINFFPAMLCIMIPAIAGAKYAGLSGFLVGTLVGTGIGVQASLIPTYVIYLMVLVVATAFVLIIRSGNRASGGD